MIERSDMPTLVTSAERTNESESFVITSWRVVDLNRWFTVAKTTSVE